MRELLDPNTHRAMFNRRQIISGVTMTGFSTLGSTLMSGEGDGISRSAESIHQEANFKASRKRIYEALTNTEQFDKITHLGLAMSSGMVSGKITTAISAEAGSPFTLFGGYVVGRQIELVPDQRIVQAWRAMSWDPGIYSLARFELVEQGAGTRIVFDHTGFPKGQAEHLAAGWKGNYWEPLEKFLS